MRTLLCLILASTLLACSSAEVIKLKSEQPQLSQYPLHHYTGQIAAKLFDQLPTQRGWVQVAPKVAVASFLPVNQLSLDDADDAQKQLANQLSESMLAHTRTRGMSAFDYHLREKLMLKADYEQALSREIAQIENSAQSSAVDTLLVGTYSQMEDGYMVNARLIRLSDKQVLAAANGYVPHNVFYSTQQVTKRGQYFYRLGGQK